ncbi:hypothetical protein [Streptomyces sp. NPDC050164]|uniref:hypothetical protein n=1 Tax=Streptomyces sp. NPDC050164 TaxID=3365605 RepID=UPI0037B797DC
MRRALHRRRLMRQGYDRTRTWRRSYLRKARQEPHELVESAGGIFGRVVGRDQLCAVLMEDLRDSSAPCC